MSFVAISPTLGEIDLSQVDPIGPGAFTPFNGGTTRGYASFYMEELRAYDFNLGGGVFVYACYAAGVTAGTVVKFIPSLVNGKVVMTASPWLGTANTGGKLGVALNTAAAGQWGWFQVDGVAVVNCSGAPAAENPVYWQANGVVSPAAVAGKQMLGAAFASAVGQTLGSGSAAIALTATQALVLLSRPICQGAIT